MRTARVRAEDAANHARWQAHMLVCPPACPPQASQEALPHCTVSDMCAAAAFAVAAARASADVADVDNGDLDAVELAQTAGLSDADLQQCADSFSGPHRRHPPSKISPFHVCITARLRQAAVITVIGAEITCGLSRILRGCGRILRKSGQPLHRHGVDMHPQFRLGRKPF